MKSKHRLSRASRDVEVSGAADVIADTVDRIAYDISEQEGVPYEYALKIAWQGARMAVKERRRKR